MYTINSISEFHDLLGLPTPLHPMVSVIRMEEMIPIDSFIWSKFFFNFYTISLKKNVSGKVKYGHQYYDFDKGTMSFTSPRQVQSVELLEMESFRQKVQHGYMLLFQTDFLNKSKLLTSILNYGFFSYNVNEALHLYQNEEDYVLEIFERISTEYQHIDKHSQDIILSQIELLLNYCNRFYERQFFTRNKMNNELLQKLEKLLNDFFSKENDERYLLTVEHLAQNMNMSAHYMSDLLRSLTGQSAQQHIHEKMISVAKQHLASTNLTVSEISYQLGFEHSQSFNKIFKKKTNMSPLKYRNLFNK